MKRHTPLDKAAIARYNELLAPLAKHVPLFEAVLFIGADLVIDSETSYVHVLLEMLQEVYTFESLEEANEIMAHLMDFYNGTVALYEKIEKADSLEEIDTMLEPCVDALLALHTPDEAQPVLHQAAFEAINHAAIAYEFESVFDEATTYEETIEALKKHPAGELPGFADAVEALLIIEIATSEENTLSAQGLAGMIKMYMTAIMQLNRVRKAIFRLEKKLRHKTGRNDPCPCGSGKKYKKCCM